VLGAALLLAGCSGGDDEPAAATPDPSAGATPVGVSCADGTGDSADPSLDLLGVRLARDGKNVRVVFDETETPKGEPVSWVVGFVSATGKHSVQLTADVRKTGDIAHGITVDDEVRPVNDPVRITAEGMTTVFPVKPIDALGRGVLWYATLALDGEEIDYCPGGAELREVLDISPLALPDVW
jgi:hypothetical protein